MQSANEGSVTKADRQFDQLYDRHFDAIFRYVLRRVANVTDAQDLTAQTFYKALRRFWRFRWSAGNASAWLYRIATNEVNNHYRSRRLGGRTFSDLDPSAVSEAVAAERNDAEQELALNRLYMDLHGALGSLPPDDQTLLVLRYFEQQPYDEIAPILGCRAGTLAMRASRALKKLKNELSLRGIDHEELRGVLASVERPRPSGRNVPAQAAP
jgi:RNA polymerase sigma-70 factor (ECF subfamily)